MFNVQNYHTGSHSTSLLSRVIGSLSYEAQGTRCPPREGVSSSGVEPAALRRFAASMPSEIFPARSRKQVFRVYRVQVTRLGDPHGHMDP